MPASLSEINNVILNGEGELRFPEVKTVQIFQERILIFVSYLFTQNLITYSSIYFYEYFRL